MDSGIVSAQDLVDRLESVFGELYPEANTATASLWKYFGHREVVRYARELINKKEDNEGYLEKEVIDPNEDPLGYILNN